MIPGATRYRNSGGDPYFSSVSLLLHGTGSNGGTSFPDSSSHHYTATPSGAAQTSTAQYPYGSGSSMLFDGSSAYLTIPSAAPLNLQASNFTVEGWVYQTASAAVAGVVTKRQNGGNLGWNFYIDSGQHLALYSDNAGGVSSTATVPMNQWSFVAWCLSGTSLSMYIDGVLANISALPYSGLVDNLYDMLIGSGHQTEYYFPGYLSEIRITKGVARYSGATCPVPTGPWADF